LLAFSSTVDFFVGLALKKTQAILWRKWILGISIGINLGLLGFFKYYNFFVESFVEAFTLFGSAIQPSTLKILLPVGISFYTFQAMTYTIDVYRRKLEPTDDIIAFFAYVSFFPQLVAGPIERAVHMMPQYFAPRVFDPVKASDGLRQILWGLFKKIVIADNCAQIVAQCFDNPATENGASLLLGAILFAFQIYCDFSGYSDIAIGTARLFGFELMKNFAFPYFSRDIAEFWRRWHISLTSWFRDYVYIPLGGSKGGIWMKTRNTFIIFLVSGFWHGANWTFIAWGILNAVYFLPLLLLNKNRSHLDVLAKDKVFPSFNEIISIVFTFVLTTLAWIFFRSNSIGEAFTYLSSMIGQLFTHPGQILLFLKLAVVEKVILFIGVLVLIEWLNRDKPHGLSGILHFPRIIRWTAYISLVFVIIYFGGEQKDFIYFQF
jgi:D-alanyl-lipoteichoic acid acyltransferase DltB (MBOAT superfamily)